jgi:hypothetical protein
MFPLNSTSTTRTNDKTTSALGYSIPGFLFTVETDSDNGVQGARAMNTGDE